MNKKHSPIVIPLALVLIGLVTLPTSARAQDRNPREAAFDKQIQPFLQQFCVRCHNAEKLTSGVRVDHLDASLSDQHLKLWEAVRHQIQTDAMPPEDTKQPTKEVRKQVIAWIDQSLTIARSRPVPKNGSTRRLTVAQYKNTIRELLLLEDDVADILPPDAISKDGFVNNQSTLQLSPLLLEAYYEIADQALSRCIVDPGAKPTIQNVRVELGESINPRPFPESLILGADSLLLNNKDFVVTEPRPEKPFAYNPFRIRTKYRFIEGYQGNDTVRGWREYDSIYHSVFACMRGSHGYPKGLAYSTVPEGLLLRPAIPSTEIFGQESTYGPRANFKIALRELPDFGRFRVTVTAAKYNDGLLLDPKSKAQPVNDQSLVAQDKNTSVLLPREGVYQVDLHTSLKKDTPNGGKTPSKVADRQARQVNLTLGDRHFVSSQTQPAFLVVRLPAGKLTLDAKIAGPYNIDKIVFTPLADALPLTEQFLAFEKATPWIGVHMGFRRDCGSTLSPVGVPQKVASDRLAKYVFEGAIRNFPNPEVEKDNVNYLAGVREIGVRSEYTDGRDMPRLLIRSVEFEGPFYETWPPPSHRNIFIDSNNRDNPQQYAKEIIRSFATRAFRRPVTAQEETLLLQVFEKSTRSGSDFRTAVKDALLVALTSPQFLFLTETSQTPAGEPLNEFELAFKLSYFLWNSPPDATTLKLASEGRLRSQLDAEISRLIADSRFGRFTNEFTSQWLSLDKFQVLEPDRTRFPRLTRDTRTYLRQEPVLFLQHLIRQNLPAKNLIESEFVLANEVTAGYYDLKSSSGFAYQPLPRTRPELGGLLSQAAILAGLSDGRESNPVKRGAWLARKIIAEPPDDPPPNVPALKEEKKNLTLRERLEQHRNQRGCAQCHTKIDPYGVAFEEFDAGGRLKQGKVDARSTLPDHKEVAGFQELRQYLGGDRIDQVAFSMMKHLATYASGRSLSYNEQAYLRDHGQKLKTDGYRLQDMIRFVINSPIFLEK